MTNIGCVAPRIFKGIFMGFVVSFRSPGNWLSHINYRMSHDSLIRARAEELDLAPVYQGIIHQTIISVVKITLSGNICSPPSVNVSFIVGKSSTQNKDSHGLN